MTDRTRRSGRWMAAWIGGMAWIGLLGAAGHAGAAGPYTVMAYYFPNWAGLPSGDAPSEKAAHSEWTTLKKTRPLFEGHDQPKVPLWGYTDDSDPQVMAMKIREARSHGVDGFLFDWYWNDQGKFLPYALEDGFLHAPNRDDMKFAVLWCNHNIGKAKGAVTPETFVQLTDYAIRELFAKPSYLRIDGKPLFAVYNAKELVASFGGVPAARAALDGFRDRAKAAGLPGVWISLDVNTTYFDGNTPETLLRDLNLDSTENYVWGHAFGGKPVPEGQLPTRDYAEIRQKYFDLLEKGTPPGEGWKVNPYIASRFQQAGAPGSKPFFPVVMMGNDTTPRGTVATLQEWVAKIQAKAGYPYGAIMVNNTPEEYEKALRQMRAYIDAHPETRGIVLLEAWNEWTEGSYLEPDVKNGYGYLDAVAKVFGNPAVPAPAPAR